MTTMAMLSMHLLQFKWLLLRFLLFCQIIILWNSADVAVMAATITSNATQYLFDTPIQLSWNYTSIYTNTNETNFDRLAILYNNTIPNDNTLNNEVQMSVAVSTLTRRPNATIRNIGTVLFDASDPDRGSRQAWPLKVGNYKAYLYNLIDFAVYASSDTFLVVPAILSINKPSYIFNESITFSRGYTSKYTNTSNQNFDFVGIYDATVMNVDLFSPIMGVYISSLTNDGANSTVRNTGMITFDSQPPNETGSLAWPLPVGSYKAMLFDFDGSTYTESDIFVVEPSPTKAPTMVPTFAPFTATPSMAPVRKKKQLFCNVFILKNIFCAESCGFIGRLLKKCKT